MLITIEGIDCAGKSSVVNTLRNDLTDENIVFTAEPTQDTWIGKEVRTAISTQNTHPIQVLLLFLADHSYHYTQKLQPYLSNGTDIICDRYIDSRYAYQASELQPYMTHMNALAYIQSLQETQWNVQTDNTFVQQQFELAHKSYTDTQIESLPAVGKYFLGLAQNKTYIQDNFDTLSTPQTDFEGLTVNQTLANNWSTKPDSTVYIDISVDESLHRLGNRNSTERFEKKNTLQQARTNYQTLCNQETDKFTTIDGNQPLSDVTTDAKNVIVDELMV